MHPRIYLLYKQADVSFNERKAANGKVLVSTVEEVINAVLIACKLLEDVKINNLVIKIINEAVKSGNNWSRRNTHSSHKSISVIFVIPSRFGPFLKLDGKYRNDPI